jgi:transposase
MKERIYLSKAIKKKICLEKFEEGESNRELAKKYGVCARTIVRISNKYRRLGSVTFERRVREESLEEKVIRLEEENRMLRDMQKVFNVLSKKK